MNAKANLEIYPGDNLDRFKELTKQPSLAWPTVILMFVVIAVFAGSTALYLSGSMGLGWTIAINAIACYLSFTVGHDASHNAVSSNRKVNEWFGRLSTVMLSPIPFFRMFRYIHMQHHRFTNDEMKDPDLYCGTGPKWSLPLRWATLDLHYFYLYLNPKVFKKRPASERKELYLAFVFATAVISGMTLAGWLEYYLLLFVIPTRIAVVFLAFAFDFLPHYPHQEHAKDEPYRCTTNRKGMEWLLTPALLSQNYHLVHHLYPTVPFYRYISVWKAKQQFHEAQNPAESSTFGLGPVS